MAAHIVVVGASLGGLRSVEHVCTSGLDARVTAVGRETHPPYNRPPLSKDVLSRLAQGDLQGESALSSIALRQRGATASVEWRLGVSADAVDLDARVLTLSDGTHLDYDGLVVATGLSPRRLELPGCENDRFVLRSLDDAINLAQRLMSGGPVVIIGAGFIGCELAATARLLGCEVTVVETYGRPMERVLGRELALAVQRRHEVEGVVFRIGRSVAGWVEGNGTLRGVLLDNGEAIRAETVIEATGSTPNVGWLRANELDLMDGVLCDNHLRVGGRPETVAVGDVARFANPLFDDTARRVEHWCMPGFTARRAVATLVAHLRRDAEPDDIFAPMPTFWSDQYDWRIQSVGAPGLADERFLLEGEMPTGRSAFNGVAVGYRRSQRLVGAVTIGLPPASLPQYRAAIAAEAIAA